jgi:hypothetical protein
MFKTFANYFPSSMRSSATSGGIPPIYPPTLVHAASRATGHRSSHTTFSPDNYGHTNKVHFIFNHQEPQDRPTRQEAPATRTSLPPLQQDTSHHQPRHSSADRAGPGDYGTTRTLEKTAPPTNAILNARIYTPHQYFIIYIFLVNYSTSSTSLPPEGAPVSADDALGCRYNTPGGATFSKFSPPARTDAGLGQTQGIPSSG